MVELYEEWHPNSSSPLNILLYVLICNLEELRWGHQAEVSMRVLELPSQSEK